MTRRLSPIALLERSVENGQGVKILGLPGKMPGKRENREEREGSRERKVRALIMHPRKVRRRELGEALLR